MRLLEHTHEVQPDAKLTVDREDGVIAISCRWPLDLTSDEWFTAELRFPDELASLCRDDYKVSGRATISSDVAGIKFWGPASGTRPGAIEVWKGQHALRRSLWLGEVPEVQQCMDLL